MYYNVIYHQCVYVSKEAIQPKYSLVMGEVECGQR